MLLLRLIYVSCWHLCCTYSFSRLCHTPASRAVCNQFGAALGNCLPRKSWKSSFHLFFWPGLSSCRRPLVMHLGVPVCCDEAPSLVTLCCHSVCPSPLPFPACCRPLFDVQLGDRLVCNLRGPLDVVGPWLTFCHHHRFRQRGCMVLMGCLLCRCQLRHRRVRRHRHNHDFVCDFVASCCWDWDSVCWML